MNTPTKNNMWHVLVEGESRGPLAFDKLKELSDKSEIFRSDTVWSPTEQDWIQADQVADLFPENKKRTDEEMLVDRMSGNYKSDNYRHKIRYRQTGGPFPGFASFIMPGLGQIIDSRQGIGFFFLACWVTAGSVNIAFLFMTIAPGGEGTMYSIWVLMLVIQFSLWLASIVDAASVRYVPDKMGDIRR